MISLRFFAIVFIFSCISFFHRTAIHFFALGSWLCLCLRALENNILFASLTIFLVVFALDCIFFLSSSDIGGSCKPETPPYCWSCWCWKMLHARNCWLPTWKLRCMFHWGSPVAHHSPFAHQSADVSYWLALFTRLPKAFIVWHFSSLSPMCSHAFELLTFFGMTWRIRDMCNATQINKTIFVQLPFFVIKPPYKWFDFSLVDICTI